MFYHEQLSNSYNFMINTLQRDFFLYSAAHGIFFKLEVELVIFI